VLASRSLRLLTLEDWCFLDLSKTANPIVLIYLRTKTNSLYNGHDNLPKCIRPADASGITTRVVVNFWSINYLREM
jgi:hypothetical protein